MFFVWLFPFPSFVLIYSDVLVFVLLYFIYYYPSEACLLSNEKQERGGSGWEGHWGRGVERGEVVIRIYYVKKNLFSIEFKKEFKGKNLFIHRYFTL